MAKPIVVYDPYRNINTTLAEFAKAEGVPKYTASHYYWWHKSLEGFRDRPAKGTGNGIKPHTYTRNGTFITLQEACRISRLDTANLKKRREKYGSNDIEEIRRRYDADKEQTRLSRMKVTEEGRKVSIMQFAKEQGVTYSSVTSWLYRKGTLNGFEDRGHSRVNPILYHHSGLGISKSKRQWAKYFKCSVDRVKGWLRNHKNDMQGFGKLKNGRRRNKTKLH